MKLIKRNNEDNILPINNGLYYFKDKDDFALILTSILTEASYENNNHRITVEQFNRSLY